MKIELDGSTRAHLVRFQRFLVSSWLQSEGAMPVARLGTDLRQQVAQKDEAYLVDLYANWLKAGEPA